MERMKETSRVNDVLDVKRRNKFKSSRTKPKRYFPMKTIPNTTIDANQTMFTTISHLNDMLPDVLGRGSSGGALAGQRVGAVLTLDRLERNRARSRSRSRRAFLLLFRSVKDGVQIRRAQLRLRVRRR